MGFDSQPGDAAASGRRKLDSWKEIANYLHTSVRTVQRWEKAEGLPVCRHEHARQDTVYAFTDDIDRWLNGRNRTAPVTPHTWEEQLQSARAALRASAAPVHIAPLREHLTVGRTIEQERLREFFANAGKSGPRMLCITGEPGIGKTTLLEGFVAESRDYCRVAYARCAERLSAMGAYSPVLELLDRLTHDNQAAAWLLRLVAPTWYVQIAPLWTVADSAVLESARAASGERMKRELTAFFAELAAHAKLVLIIDDLHWADASTVEALSYVCTHLHSDGLLVVAAYRPTEMSLTRHPFIAVRQELTRLGICEELAVSPLDRLAIERYLSLEFPANDFPEPFAASLYTRTEGNPFFLVELIGDLRGRNSIRHDGAKWLLDVPVHALDTSFPASVHSMISLKIDQLADEDRRLLMAAAVQGVDFDSAVVADALGVNAGAAEERLQELARIHLFIRIVGDGDASSLRCSFAHVLYQNAFYSLLTPARRAELSVRVADAFLRSPITDPAHISGQLALLYETGREYRQASDWYLEAAKNAARVYANHEAVELSRRAIRNAERLPEEEQWPRVLQAGLQLAELHLRLSEFAEAVADFGLAEKAAGEAGLQEARIDSVCGAALALLNLKRTDEMQPLGRRALELAKATGSDSLVASAEMVIAMERMCAGDLDSAEKLVLRAAPLIRESRAASTPLHIIESIGYEAALHGWRLEYGQAVPACDWALERARERGAVFHIVCLLFIRGLGLGNFGRLGDSFESVREAMRLAETNQDRYWLPRLPNTLGWLHREAFDLDQALRLNQEGTTMAREFGFMEGEVNSHINLAHDYVTAGELDAAEEHLRAAERLFSAEAWFRWVYRTRLEAGFTHYWIARGDLQRAASCGASSLKLAEHLRRRKYVAWNRKLLGDIAVAEERHSDAENHYAAGLRALEGHPCPSVEWRILDALADLHSRLRRTDAADEYRARARHTLQQLADSLRPGAMRTTFLASRPARELNLSA